MAFEIGFLIYGNRLYVRLNIWKYIKCKSNKGKFVNRFKIIDIKNGLIIWIWSNIVNSLSFFNIRTNFVVF
jgi:hypothetical protein